MTLRKVTTTSLRIAYEDSGPKDGERLLLLHGWPDSPATWHKVLPALHEAGYRTIAPYLRGYGQSEFRKPWFGKKPRRTGQPVAFARDVIDLADHLKLSRFHFIGHDWGARTAYALAALFPKRLKSIVAISVPFEPGPAVPPELPQAQAFWYQWLLCTHPGEKKFRSDPVAYGKAQWDAWSPPGWYTQAEFDEAARSWTGKDFQDVVLHSYRSRWGHARLDDHYAKEQAKFLARQTLSVPTLLLHGALDRCELLQTTDGAERHFSGRYERIVLDGVGHFPQREAAEQTASLMLKHLQEARNGTGRS